MNEFVARFRNAYGKDWMFVLNRQAVIRDQFIERHAFFWGREIAQMLGLDE